MRLGNVYAELVFRAKPASWTDNEWGVVLACFNVGTMILSVVVLSLVI